MKVCLLSRYFTTNQKEGVGIGRVSGKILKGLTEAGIEVYPLYTKGSGLSSYFWYTYMGVPLSLFKADIYHALTPMEGMWLPRNKSVVTYHDLFQITNPERVGGGMGYSNFKREFGRKYFEWASRKSSTCKIITCVSEKTKEEVIKYLNVPESKIRVIRSGINNNLEPQSIRGTNPPEGKPRFGYLGMLDKRKRVDLLIDTFKKYNSMPEATLNIYGRGLDSEKLETLAKGDKRIILGGYIDDRSMPWFYNSLDVFVFPTAIEGYGLPIVEAMACKRPVVVLHDSLIPREVKNRCIIVQTLDMIFRDRELLDKMVARVNIEDNYKWAKEHSWSNTIKEYIKAYEEIKD